MFLWKINYFPHLTIAYPPTQTRSCAELVNPTHGRGSLSFPTAPPSRRMTLLHVLQPPSQLLRACHHPDWILPARARASSMTSIAASDHPTPRLHLHATTAPILPQPASLQAQSISLEHCLAAFPRQVSCCSIDSSLATTSSPGSCTKSSLGDPLVLPHHFPATSKPCPRWNFNLDRCSHT